MTAKEMRERVQDSFRLGMTRADVLRSCAELRLAPKETRTHELIAELHPPGIYWNGQLLRPGWTLVFGLDQQDLLERIVYYGHDARATVLGAPPEGSL
jgi:hypothetical protein